MSRACAIHVGPGRRAGFTLIEVLVTIMMTSVAMSTAAALVHRALRLEAASRRVLERERALLVLARQVRADVHRARAVACAGDVLPEGVVLRVTITGGTIDYRLAAGGLVREESRNGRTTRESFACPTATRWWAVREGRVVTLRADGAADPTGGSHIDPGVGPPPAVDVVAVIGGADGEPDAEASP